MMAPEMDISKDKPATAAKSSPQKQRGPATKVAEDGHPQEASQAQCETTGGGGKLAGSASGEKGRGRAAARGATRGCEQYQQ